MILIATPYEYRKAEIEYGLQVARLENMFDVKCMMNYRELMGKRYESVIVDPHAPILREKEYEMWTEFLTAAETRVHVTAPPEH